MDAIGLAQDSPPDPNYERRFYTQYRIRLSTLYHRKRERFFDMLDKLVSGFIAVSATAAVTTIFQGQAGADKVLAAITAALSLIPVVFNPAQKARHHNQLVQEYCKLLADCELAGEVWMDKQCNEFSARIIQISASEPTPLSALIADCQNEMAIAFNTGPVAKLEWYHHLLKHFFDIRPPPIAT